MSQIDQRPTAITHVAVRDSTGAVHIAPTICTHAQFRSQLERNGVTLTPNPEEPWDNGFITDTGIYVHRRAAAGIALRYKQVTEIKHPHFGLMTSDLWPKEIPE